MTSISQREKYEISSFLLCSPVVSIEMTITLDVSFDFTTPDILHLLSPFSQTYLHILKSSL